MNLKKSNLTSLNILSKFTTGCQDPKMNHD